MIQRKEAPVRKYKQVIAIPSAELAIINGFLNATSKDEYQDEDETITYTAKFPDGKEMDIKCCGCQDDSSWTEAVLFTRSGHELACSDPNDEFACMWEIEYDGITYIVDVVPSGINRANVPHK